MAQDVSVNASRLVHTLDDDFDDVCHAEHGYFPGGGTRQLLLNWWRYFIVGASMENDPERLAKQFRKSLQTWGGAQAQIYEDPTYLITAVSDHIASLYDVNRPLIGGRYEGRQDEWRVINALSRVFFNACLVQQLDRFTHDFDFLLDSLESPMEALMLLSLIVCARENYKGVSVVWKHANPKYGKDENHSDFSAGPCRLTIEIRPQATIGDHRVDFLLSYYGTKLVQKEKLGAGSGNNWQEIQVDKKMVVECDGHEFHEKTKDQAQRDKERDRILQSAGYHVFHYTGSELYADAFRGASQIIQFLTGEELFKPMYDDDKHP